MKYQVTIHSGKVPYVGKRPLLVTEQVDDEEEGAIRKAYSALRSASTSSYILLASYEKLREWTNVFTTILADEGDKS